MVPPITATNSLLPQLRMIQGVHLIYRPSLHHSSVRYLTNNAPQATSASSKLFADAAREEAEASSQTKTTLNIEKHENWTGEESTQDAVLRMLIDKYKPLRGGSIQSAEQRLKQNPPRVWTSGQISVAPSTGSWSSQPLLPSSVDHQPWHTQFKAPSHATSSIKHANIPSVSIRKPSMTAQDDRARRKEKEEKKKEERIERLAQARESILDYRLGVRRVDMRRANPITLKGWAGLIEDKIQVG
jgi:DnaJ family protein C protein 28